MLITGASAGLGEEFARQLAPYARRLFLVARRTERLEALKKELEAKQSGLEVCVFAVDLGDAASRDGFCNSLSNDLVIDFLINNAGLGDHGRFESSDWGKIRSVLEVNVIALTALTHRLVPLMRKNGSGAILNVSSVASVMPIPKLAVYAATKAYVSSFTEALRAELRGTGISVTSVCPGPVDTEFKIVADRPGTAGLPTPEWFKVTPQEVVWDALKAVSRDRARVFPGLHVAAVAIFISLIPIFVLRFFLNKYVERKRP